MNGESGAELDRADVVCLRPKDDFLKLGITPPETLSIRYLLPDDSALPHYLAEARALVIPAVGPTLPAELFDASRIELVQVTGAGVDRLDAVALKAMGIAIANVPGGSSAAIAEYAVSSALMLLRRKQRKSEPISNELPESDRLARRLSSLIASEQAFQQAEAEVSAAAAALVEASASRQQLLVLDKQLTMLSHRKEQILAQRDRQELDLQDRVIRSPLDGVVDKVFVNPSEYVAAGQRLMMVHDPQKIWVSANIKETEIRHVRIGATATIIVDAYPDEVFHGKIIRIGSAATSQFALLPKPNPSGNFTKITQRLSMKIAVEQNNRLLRPGMMVEVNIGIDDR